MLFLNHFMSNTRVMWALLTVWTTHVLVQWNPLAVSYVPTQNPNTYYSLKTPSLEDCYGNILCFLSFYVTTSFVSLKAHKKAKRISRYIQFAQSRNSEFVVVPHPACLPRKGHIQLMFILGTIVLLSYFDFNRRVWQCWLCLRCLHIETDEADAWNAVTVQLNLLDMVGFVSTSDKQYGKKIRCHMQALV